ncbi:MAG: hypothetical protein KME56_18590 [Candidatus Thiodiazotropha sp. (ex Ctena orbiculata)]|uniref:Uncharacterized protein n=1 Tax=Candidatus Thiodiazotropha taylori TaxID=2792791 RepID=A0A944M7U2_9GAMM|nr:hypothetical protein [Candidatus Thiodiazotropha taylori]MBT2988768.1 hypothetical protein [Candidatus Thiodiazotropha taylori]MBT2998621.1 hypothetical protein [Candidatus Thiodiazotropha taylori]MBT3001463.1 hypothetical protein [Candidatus Thiodiazotropha taylori]MBV2106099.1 hypothetical protein [Candidatus Thiodiazotropha taylori]
MKWCRLLLLLPSLAVAQPPGAQMDPQQFFEQSKQKMLPMMDKSVPAMKETKSCLEKAEDQAAFEKCSEIMIAMEKEIKEKMGPVPGMPEGPKGPTKGPKDIQFTPEAKQNMLQFLDRSIMIGMAMQKCFTQSDTADEMQRCMQAARPKQ